MPRIIPACLYLLVATSIAFAADPPPVPDTLTLAPKWTAGQTSTYHLEQSEVTTRSAEVIGAPANVQAEPASQETTMRLEGDVTWTVTEADEAGGGAAVMTMTNMKMTLGAPDAESKVVTADRAPEGLDSARDWLAAMSDKPVTYTIDAAGQVTGVSGHKAITAALGEAGDRLDEDYFMQLAEDLALLTGGSGERSVGDTWKHAHTSDHRTGEIAYDDTYEVASITPVAGVPVVLINRTSKMKFTPTLPQLPPDAPVPDVKLTAGEQTAQLMFDASRHELVGSNTDRVFEVTTLMTRGPITLKGVYREVTNTQVLRTSEN